MNQQFYKGAFGWGFILWLFGYILGFLFFAFVPPALLGWAIMPFGITFTLWVLFKKIKIQTPKEFLLLAVVWALMAITLDYIFIIKVLKPADGYYKLDVYLYYILTFTIPLIFGLRKKANTPLQ